MASNIQTGQTIRITVRFVDFGVDSETDELIEPLTVSGVYYKFNDTTHGYDLIESISPIVHDSFGIYYYDWNISTDGKFKFLFTGTFTATATPLTTTNERVFYVGSAFPTVTLPTALEFTFLGKLDPLYIDPEEIKSYFPSVNLVEATEIIHRLSVDLQTWFGIGLTLTPLMEDWLLATTLCELTRIYTFNGGMNGFGQASSFQLGELQVAHDTRSAIRLNNNGLGLGQATTWCELAALLKNRLNADKTKPLSTVKGSSYNGNSPIPSRYIRNFD